MRVYATTVTSTQPPNAIYGEMTSKAAAFSTSSVTLPALKEIVVRMNGLVVLPAGAVIAFPGLNVVTNKVFFSLNGVPYIQGTSPPITAGTKYIEFRCCSEIQGAEFPSAGAFNILKYMLFGIL